MQDDRKIKNDCFEEYSKRYGYIPNIQLWAKKHRLNIYVAIAEHREIKEPIISEIINKKVCCVLDIGCGYGFLMERLNQSCPTTTLVGTDLSKFQIVNAKLRGIKGDFVVCCAEYMPFKNSFFDFIACSEVIEHVGSKKDSLAEMNRMLRCGGYLSISTDNPLSIYRRFLDYIREKIGRVGEAYEEYISQYVLTLNIPKSISIYKALNICPYSLLPSIGPFALSFVGRTWVQFGRFLQKTPYVGNNLCNKYIIFGVKRSELID